MNAPPIFATEPVSPFPSLAALQAEHAELQAKFGRVPTAEPVVDFIRRAVQTGSRLDSRTDREAAQSIINYWVSRATAASTSEEAGAARYYGHPFSDPDFDSLLVGFDAATLDEARADAEQWVRKLSDDDATLVRRSLMRMVRLTGDGKVIPVPMQRETLDDLEPRERVDELLAELVRLGVVRGTIAADQSQEFGLRSPELLDRWGFLKDAVEQRKQFRARVDAWEAQRKSPGRSDFRRTLRRWLVSVGKRVDAAWDGIIRLFGVQQHLVSDPAAELPDVDYYRDRTQPEIDYLFRRRAEAKDDKEWLRIVKGLVFLVVLATATVGSLVYYRWKADLATAKAEASRIELEKRRARQRLKEHVNLVRQLAQFQQYNDGDSRDQSRADVARWRIESPILRDEGDQENYIRELKLLGVAFDVREGAICVFCSAKPIVVAKQIRTELLGPRVDPSNEQEYDKDTDSYRRGLIRDQYDAVSKLTTAICNALDETKTDVRSRDYDSLAGYMDEFWVLYSGEMAIVESETVESAMVEFGEALLKVDAIFSEALAEKLAAVGDTNQDELKKLTQLQTLDDQPRNAVARSNAYRPESKPAEWSVVQNSFLQKPLPDLRTSFGDVKQKELAAAVDELRRSYKRLEQELKPDHPSTVKKHDHPAAVKE